MGRDSQERFSTELAPYLSSLLLFLFFSFPACPAGERQAPAGHKGGNKRLKAYGVKGYDGMKFNLFQKMLCLLFSALAVFCAAMTGTHAWRDASQHRSNEFYGGLTATTDESDTTTTEPDTTTTEPGTTTTATTSTTTTIPSTEPSITMTETTTETTTQATIQTTAQTTSQTYTLPSTSMFKTSTGTSGPSNPGGPKTDDTSKIWLWAALTVVSAMGLRTVLLWGRRNDRHREEAA